MEVQEMPGRRPMGSLEASVLEQLWQADAPMTPAEVQAALDVELAYTTVMTILVRLWKKGAVSRERDGRAYAYSAIGTKAEVLADRMKGELGRAKDRQAVLSRFVDSLSKKDAKALQELMKQLDS